MQWKKAVQTACQEVCSSLKDFSSNKHTAHQAWHSVEPLVAFKENETEWGQFTKLIEYCVKQNGHLGERCNV